MRGYGKTPRIELEGGATYLTPFSVQISTPDPRDGLGGGPGAGFVASRVIILQAGIDGLGKIVGTRVKLRIPPTHLRRQSEGRNPS